MSNHNLKHVIITTFFLDKEERKIYTNVQSIKGGVEGYIALLL